MWKPQMTQSELDYCLFDACRIGHHNFATLALAVGADVNAKDGVDRTPLHYAAEHVQPDIVRLLIQHGANINARDSQALTPRDCVPERSAILPDAQFADTLTLLRNAARQQGHTSRVTNERTDKGPPQVGG